MHNVVHFQTMDSCVMHLPVVIIHSHQVDGMCERGPALGFGQLSSYHNCTLFELICDFVSDPVPVVLRYLRLRENIHSLKMNERQAIFECASASNNAVIILNFKGFKLSLPPKFRIVLRHFLRSDLPNNQES